MVQRSQVGGESAWDGGREGMVSYERGILEKLDNYFYVCWEIILISRK